MIYFVFEMDKSSKSKSKPVKRWPAEFKPRLKRINKTILCKQF